MTSGTEVSSRLQAILKARYCITTRGTEGEVCSRDDPRQALMTSRTKDSSGLQGGSRLACDDKLEET